MTATRDSRKRLGDEGERVARQYLHAQGYTLVAANFRVREGEVDLICTESLADGSLLYVFVEVKTRSDLEFGDPLESLTEEKMARVRRAAEIFLLRHADEDAPCRFDAIGILITPEGPRIEHEIDIIDY